MNDEKVRNEPQAAEKIEDLPVAEANTDEVKGGALVVDNGSGMHH